jgi:aryl-alcohol dehydrogenase-like predicted oxidoreductase
MFKLIIGTANFSHRYGFEKFKIKNLEIKKIFKEISKNKIRYLDTAINYNLKKKTFRNINLNKIKVTTKIKLPDKNKLIFIFNLKRKLLGELAKLNLKKFDTLLLHNVEDLRLNQYRLPLLKEMKKLKSENLISKIGVSIYDTEDLKIVLKNFKPDVIQLPVNVLDQRFLKKNLLKKLNRKKILIQARSIFLQGLLLKKNTELEKVNCNDKLKKRLKIFNNWCASKNISQLNACISFIKSIKYLDFIVLGINNSNHLTEILKNLKIKNNYNKFEKFSVKSKKIVDPRKW